MAIVCCIDYRLDPFRLADFERYAEQWAEPIPAAGGELIGYFMPHEGANNAGMALIGFDSLAAYEAYRTRLKTAAAGQTNFDFARDNHFILGERRTFLRPVPSTYLRGKA